MHPSRDYYYRNMYIQDIICLPPTEPHTVCNQVVHLLLNSGIICQIVILIVELRESLQGIAVIASLLLVGG